MAEYQATTQPLNITFAVSIDHRNAADLSMSWNRMRHIRTSFSVRVVAAHLKRL
jgi:hypothetical protein